METKNNNSQKKQLIFRYASVGLIITTVFILYFFRIGQEGYSNPYYAAAVKGMITDWHNFFFVSFDSEGYVSVDKPPLGLWLQGLSALILGFRGWALILPQILSTIISVLAIYFIIKKNFGKTAGFISAFALTATPSLVAVSRSNNLDAIVVMFLLLATWFVIFACEKERVKYFIFAMVLVGLGFNVKMLQAFMVIPAFYLVYYFSTSLNRKTKLLHLAVSTLVLLAVSFSWSIIVDITPATDRPYVGGSYNNSVIELIIGYNGIMRVLPPPPDAFHGTHGPPGGPPVGPPGPPGPGGPGGIFKEVGFPGPFRLFSKEMAGQISWLFPFALLGLIFSFQIIGKNERCKRRQLLLWASCMGPMIIYFSISGFMHRYYLVMLAPSLSALTGISLSEMWKDYVSKKGRSYYLPLTIAITGLIQGIFLERYENRFSIIIITLFLIIAVALVIFKSKNIHKAAFTAGIISIFIMPVLWSLTPVIYGNEPRLPYAGPELSKDFPGKMPEPEAPNLDILIDFLIANKGDEKFLVVVPDANIASPIILKTGEAVMAMGGFNGNDRILTLERLKKMIKEGDIRFFLLFDRPFSPSPELPIFKISGVTFFELNEWVKENGTIVPNVYLDIGKNQPGGPLKWHKPDGQLYDLRP